MRAEEEHLPMVIALQDVAFGAGWSTLDELRAKCDLGGASVALCEDAALGEAFRVRDGQYVCGYRAFAPPGTWQVGLWADMAPCSEEQWRQLGFQSLALAKAIIVHPDMQGRGIGEQLMRGSFERARTEYGADGMLVHVWRQSRSAVAMARKRRDKVPLLEIATHPNAWRQFSIDANWTCLYCGAPPCHCGAIEAIYDLRNL